jgi:hypothetical protein
MPETFGNAWRTRKFHFETNFPLTHFYNYIHFSACRSSIERHIGTWRQVISDLLYSKAFPRSDH